MVRKQSRIRKTVPPIQADDFMLIKGIGPVLAGRLYDVGICNYKQLASLSPAKLAETVTGLSASQISKQDWSGQARKLASKKSAPKSLKNAALKKAVRQHYENFTLEFLMDEKHAVRRTRVAHIQSGDADTWSGWETRQLIDFLARHTGVRVAMERTEKQAGSADINRDIIKGRNSDPQIAEMEITASIPRHQATTSHIVSVKDPNLPTIRTPVFPPLGGKLCLRRLEVRTRGSDRPVTFIRQDQPYMARLALDLSEMNEPGDLPLICKASVISRQLGGGTRHSIGEIVSTLNFSKNVNLDINCMSLPPGTYRLEAFAEIRYDEVTPGPTASLKGSLLLVN